MPRKQEKSKYELSVGRKHEILNLLSSYSKSLTLLDQYDKNALKAIKGKKAEFILRYSDVQGIIADIKRKLQKKKEAGGLFGQEYKGKFEGIIGGLYQTFGKKELYSSIEEKASHLLYLIIKDHPFVDGNKRIASFLFVYFLNKNNFLYRESRENKINDNTLVSLTLLIAISDSKDKETMTKLVMNLLQ